MFQSFNRESWLGRRLTVWWSTVKLSLWWIWVVVIGTAFAALVFVRDEFLSSDLQGALRLVNIIGLVPWHAYIVGVLLVLLLVTIEGMYRLSEAYRVQLETVRGLVDGAQPVRKKSQTISDGLRAYHARGLKLFHQKIRNEAERKTWKDSWRQFNSDLWKEMEVLECSEGEIYRVKNRGFVPTLAVPGTHPNALGLKSELYEELKQLEVIADMHDTTKPESS
jgi:hypothetical protein